MTQKTKETASQDIVERLRKDARGPTLEAADYIEQLRTGNRLHLELAEIKEGEIERLRKGFVWLDDTIEGHLLLNPENKDSKLIQEIKRKISFILSNGGE